MALLRKSKGVEMYNMSMLSILPFRCSSMRLCGTCSEQREVQEAGADVHLSCHDRVEQWLYLVLLPVCLSVGPILHFDF